MLGLRSNANRQFPVSLTLITALALLGLGCVAIFSMVFGTGPFD